MCIRDTPNPACFIKGQLETGNTTGYLHWQLIVYFEKQQRLAALKKIFGEGIHAEPTRSEAVEQYVFKDETRVDGTQFELGKRAINRNNPKDWEAILSSAKQGRLDDIPPDVYIRCYNSLKRIAVDNLKPCEIEREIKVYCGRTGTGKSRRAWEEAGISAYPKDPRTKFWDGYGGQTNVVMDEYRGAIDISHLLRWLDRYPVIVEVKGGATVLQAKYIWITSNLHPKDWYPDLDPETLQALLRRINITIFH